MYLHFGQKPFGQILSFLFHKILTEFYPPKLSDYYLPLYYTYILNNLGFIYTKEQQEIIDIKFDSTGKKLF
jgi:hypothetical protein